MRITEKTPTWRIVVDTALTIGTLLAFGYAVAEEHWRLAAIAGLIVIVGAIENARDSMLDHIERTRR